MAEGIHYSIVSSYMWHCAVQFLKKWTCRNLSRTRHVFDSESHASSLTLSPAVHVECHTVHVLRDLNCLCWNVPSSVSVTDGSAPPLPLHTMTCAPSATPTSVHGLFNGVYACNASGRLLKREREREKNEILHFTHVDMMLCVRTLWYVGYDRCVRDREYCGHPSEPLSTLLLLLLMLLMRH